MNPRNRRQRMPEKRGRQKMPRVRTRPIADESRHGPGVCGAPSTPWAAPAEKSARAMFGSAPSTCCTSGEL